MQHKTAKGWRKLMGIDALFSPYVEFRVYEAGRWRAQREGTKNVHAYAIVREYTELPVLDHRAVGKGFHVIGYTPFNLDGFATDSDITNVASAVACTFAPSGIIYARSVSGAH